MSPPPLSLYLHFPWCVRRCPYCDFNSYALHGTLPEDIYIQALVRDVEAQAREVGGREIVSIFLGGGTPSLFSPASIARLLEAVRAALPLAPSLEVTLEANPGTIERGRFAEYRAAGINRVSLGAQSFDAGRLERLGRIHSPEDTRTAAEELHAAGLENFNIDLMYALPSQDLAGALADVDAALELEPAHVSHYQLTIEPGTVFAADPPPRPDDDDAAAMLVACQERLSARGFAQYEVSAYARPGRRCAHNLNYWRFGDYLGAGAGAHGKLTDTSAGAINRTTHVREARRYLAGGPAAPTRRTVSPAELPFELMLNALRLVEGFELDLIEARTGLERREFEPALRSLAARGLVALDEARCRATALGMRFLNDLLLEFLPPAAARPGATESRMTAGA
jgi:oxygen-independent coproporphyrinogen-3 oxidase